MRPTLVLFAVLSAFACLGARVTVLFTNDVHAHIDDGNVSYGQIAAYRDSLRENDESTILVDAGDYIQGSAFGKIDRGASVIDIMNAAGYQAATIGNHEFDYGIPLLLSMIRSRCRFPVVACNFWMTNTVANTRERVLPAYTVVTSGTTRVAFVGVATPESRTFSSPKNFLDPTGSYWLYDFDAGADGQDLFSSVQSAVNEAARKADAVIVLSHLGLGGPGEPWKSPDLIAHTTNFIAVIDGHSHTTVAASNVLNAAGQPVRLVQSGSYLKALGLLTIEDGKVADSRLLTSLGPTNRIVNVAESALMAKVNAWLGRKLAVSDVRMQRYGHSRNETGETNLGDFATDALWWFASTYAKGGCDLALVNYAGLRSNIASGDVTLRTANDVCPFGNAVCVIEATGRQLRDALEWGARKTPDYVGAFLHCAGMRYTIVTSRPSTVASRNGVWTGGPTNGVYRVQGIEVYDRATRRFLPLDLERTYRIAGCDYTLRYCGEGFDMLRTCKTAEENLQLDYLVLASYAKAFAPGKDGWPRLKSANSPLASLSGYPINYSSVGGAGRITRIQQNR